MISAIEGLAEATLADVGLEDEDVVDAEEVAALHGYWLEPVTGGRAWIDGARIYVPTAVRDTRRNRLVAHELAHALLVAHLGHDENNERNADALAARVIMPRRPLIRSLRVVGWDLLKLRARHTLVSAELIARRIAEVREATVTIVDDGRVHSRVASPWLPVPGGMTKLERECLAEARESSERVERGWCSATPIVEGERRRVIVIVDAEQASFRF